MSLFSSAAVSSTVLLGAFLSLAAPTFAQTNIDFELGAPSTFIATVPLTTQYSSLGVVFSGSAVNVGGCVLDEAGNFGVDARSGTNFAAFATNGTNSLGGSCGGPLHMDFAQPIGSITIYGSGGGGAGATFLMEAFDGGTLVASTTVVGAGGNQYKEISLGTINPPADRVTLTETTGKTAWVFDDLTFDMPVGLVAFCLGDGSGSNCPCGNQTTGDGGCANSTGVGAIASSAGSLSLGADLVTVTTTNLIPGQAALLFSGTLENNGGNGSFFGDGLLCVSGPITRLGVKVPNGSGQAVWGPGILSSLVGAQVGDLRTVQVWYRDTAGFPCGSGLNLSNGLSGTLLP